MACPFGHPESDIEEHDDGKRVCKACRRKYKNQSNKRIQSAVARNRNKRAASKRSKNNERINH